MKTNLTLNLTFILFITTKSVLTANPLALGGFEIEAPLPEIIIEDNDETFTFGGSGLEGLEDGEKEEGYISEGDDSSTNLSVGDGISTDGEGVLQSRGVNLSPLYSPLEVKVETTSKDEVATSDALSTGGGDGGDESPLGEGSGVSISLETGEGTLNAGGDESLVRQLGVEDSRDEKTSEAFANQTAVEKSPLSPDKPSEERLSFEEPSLESTDSKDTEPKEEKAQVRAEGVTEKTDVKKSTFEVETVDIVEGPGVSAPSFQQSKGVQSPSLRDLELPLESKLTERATSLSDEKSVERALKLLEKDVQKLRRIRAKAEVNKVREEISADDQPLGAVFRLLAEQAGFNFVEPRLDPNETISFRLQNITPSEAFMKIAKARGFSVETRNGITTLHRPDILEPKVQIVRKYPLKHIQPKWVVQQVANLLGISITSPNEVLSSYPNPDAGATTYGSASQGGGGSGGAGGIQNIGLPNSPRWEPSLPYDEPLQRGQGPPGTATENWVFIDRNTNSLVVKATEEEHNMIEKYLKRADKPEPQILIETKVLELTTDGSLNLGSDWNRMLGEEGGLRIEGSGQWNMDWGSIIFGGGGVPNLSVRVQNAEVVIRALQRLGKGTITNMPKTLTRSGVPVAISSTITQSSPSYQIANNNGGTVTTPSGFNTFTTGLTIDVVANLLENGVIDLNINPTVANKIGETPVDGGVGGRQSIPIISTRSITASASIRSGMTIMIGGLTEVSQTEQKTGIPVLSQVPILGKTVFGNTLKQHVRRTLLIFLTANVIYPEEYIAVYTNKEEYEGFKEGLQHDIEMETRSIPRPRKVMRAIKAH